MGILSLGIDLEPITVPTRAGDTPPEATTDTGKVVVVPRDLANWFYGSVAKGNNNSTLLLADLEDLEVRGVFIGKSGIGMHPEAKAVSPQSINHDTTVSALTSVFKLIILYLLTLSSHCRRNGIRSCRSRRRRRRAR